jgi:uncharacterized damage-inducible protein DinB
MKWTDLLRTEIEYNYQITEKLLDLVEDSVLDWKPTTGKNWMTTGQLVRHTTTACGTTLKGFVTGDWGLPPGVDPSEMSPEDMMPPAEKMPTIESVSEAKKLLAEDKVLALEMLDLAGEDRLENEDSPAPWDPRPVPLGLRLLGMVGHLTQHKGQLFYYLKLQGHDVNTGHLWGM